jgi:phosphatidylserine decarboxylase
VLERLFVHAAARPALSRAICRLSDLRVPKPLLRTLIRAYVRAYGVDLSEAAQTLETFDTFNAFFTRRLRDGARPVADAPDVVVSPADARLQSFGCVPADGRLEQIKGRTYALEALLGDPREAALFRHGVHATLYLSPSMYHRVHAPADGRIVSWRYLPGRLFPVNGPAVRQIDGLFAVNERVAMFLETAAFGLVAVVMVGAANVARISLAFDGLVTNAGGAAADIRPPAPVAITRGAELGTFNLGSTVVLLAADPTLEPAGVEHGAFIKMGAPLWRKRGRD